VSREREKPIVLVSADVVADDVRGYRIQLDGRYLDALMDAGCRVVLASPGDCLEELCRLSDAWLITGGDDLPEDLLGEPLHPEARVAHPLRIGMERTLYQQFNSLDKPILGICFGCQFLNVIEGGSLVQHVPDLPTAIEHRNTSHSVTIEPGTILGTIIGREAVVASSHHQAIRKVAQGWHVAARSEDGIIEAIERSGETFRIGVQWHPERTPDSPATRALFAAFVEAATRREARAPRG
jgi:putative glutamine amidotransferase